MKNNELLQKKWQKFLKYRRFFSYVPFLDFVLVAGSLAMGPEEPPFGGNVHEDSDFDVIVGAREGRIFTVRAFCIFIFGALGVRRKRGMSKEDSRDKICFSHFVTPKSYQLSPPYNDYWKKLYQNLVPVYGREKSVQEFFKANEWAYGGRSGFPNINVSVRRPDLQNIEAWKPTLFNPVRIFLEFILHEFLGDIFEKFMKKIQLERIKESLKRDAGYKPRLRFSDEELEFHPDTRRIEEMLKKRRL